MMSYNERIKNNILLKGNSYGEKMDKIDYSYSSNAISSAKNNTYESSAKSIYQILERVYEK